QIEMELGVFGWERAGGEDAFIVPQMVINYGLTQTLEVIGEFEVIHPPAGGTQIADPGLFLKSVMRRGTLQNRPGLSVAVEGGVLLPSTVTDEDRLGIEVLGIVSGTLSRFTWHLNIGAGANRSNQALFGKWGLIVEVPVTSTFRIVTEWNGEHDGAPDTSALLGAIWEPPQGSVALDVGLRRGISNAADDWAVNLGLTVSF
ncbi:MAG: hypothetical protein WA970_21160, partial [Gammaproteobacteria bacterium]